MQEDDQIPPEGQSFRVLFRRWLCDPWQHRLAESYQAAQRQRRQLRNQGFAVAVQHWNAQEQRWVG